MSRGEYVPALRFRWLTPAYDVVIRATTRERTFKRALIAQANIAAGQRVLDVACGTGTLAIWITQRCPQASVTGIDGDTNILAIASRTAQELFRVMRPGGELHVADWGGRASGPLMRACFVAVQVLDGCRNTKDNIAGRLVERAVRADPAIYPGPDVMARPRLVPAESPAYTRDRVRMWTRVRTFRPPGNDPAATAVDQ